MTRNATLLQLAQHAGLTMLTYRPGDGYTRYRFTTDDTEDFHAARSLHQAHGVTDAETFLRGVLLGRELEGER